MAQVGIFVGTVYGNSLLVAEEAENILNAQGHVMRSKCSKRACWMPGSYTASIMCW